MKKELLLLALLASPVYAMSAEEAAAKAKIERVQVQAAELESNKLKLQQQETELRALLNTKIQEAIHQGKFHVNVHAKHYPLPLINTLTQELSTQGYTVDCSLFKVVTVSWTPKK